jgi:hypothetical protein
MRVGREAVMLPSIKPYMYLLVKSHFQSLDQARWAMVTRMGFRVEVSKILIKATVLEPDIMEIWMSQMLRTEETSSPS